MVDTIITPKTYSARWDEVSIPGACAESGSSHLVELKWTDKRTGSKLAGWRQRATHHESATTLSDGTLSRVSANTSTAKGIYKPVGVTTCQPAGSVLRREVYGHWVRLTAGDLTPPLNSADPTGRTYTQASQNFYNAVKDAYRPFDGPTFLGELRETVHMIKHPMDAILRQQRAYLKRCRNPRIRQLVRNRRYDSASKILSDLWLEAYLGWLPLVGNVEDGLNLLDVLTSKEEFQHVVGVGINNKAGSSVNTTLSSSVSLSATMVTRKETKYIVRFLGEVKMETSSSRPSSSAIGQLAGFSWENVAITAWELLPMSFLVDYVTNIGDIINATFTSLGNVTWCNQTKRATIKTTAEGFGLLMSSPSPGSYVLGSPGSMTAEATIFNRSAQLPLVPTLMFQVPSLKQNLTATALVASHASSRRYLNT